MKDDYSLAELLRGHKPDQLRAVLAATVAGSCRLRGLDRSVLVTVGEGGEETGWHAHELVFGVETIGWLECAPSPLASAACAWLQMLIWSGARYLMAADTHKVAVQADYEALVEQHARVVASEAALRELATSLDRRVQDQVHIIEEAQRQLYQANKLAAVGQLAAGVAHEINTPLGFIRSNMRSAQHYLGQLEQFAQEVDAASPAGVVRPDLRFALDDFRDLLAESLTGADHVAAIVANLKVFSSIDRAERILGDLNAHIMTAVELLRSKLEKGQSIALDLAPLPPARLVGGAINQAIYNVLMNAVQSLPQEAGELRILTRREDGNAVFSVIDNGCGMSQETLSRAFDPFFTTRDVGGGTGLGLTVARDVVIAHGGRIELHSEAGKGTEVEIRLPLEGSNP